jgi:hypothetical protein
VAAFQLDINVGPGIVALYPQPHEAIVKSDSADDQKGKNSDEDPHSITPQGMWATARAAASLRASGTSFFLGQL